MTRPPLETLTLPATAEALILDAVQRIRNGDIEPFQLSTALFTLWLTAEQHGANNRESAKLKALEEECNRLWLIAHNPGKSLKAWTDRKLDEYVADDRNWPEFNRLVDGIIVQYGAAA